jgi:hypothetical protein
VAGLGLRQQAGPRQQRLVRIRARIDPPSMVKAGPASRCCGSSGRSSGGKVKSRSPMARMTSCTTPV